MVFKRLLVLQRVQSFVSADAFGADDGRRVLVPSMLSVLRL